MKIPKSVFFPTLPKQNYVFFSLKLHVWSIDCSIDGHALNKQSGENADTCWLHALEKNCYSRYHDKIDGNMESRGQAENENTISSRENVSEYRKDDFECYFCT